MDKFELVRFTDDGFELDVRTDSENETVWLTQKEMSLLFDVSIDNISLHIKNILKDKELDYSVVEESSVTASDGKKYLTKLYNLDMIISVGYRVKSQRGIIFRRWANSVLKDYLLKGYAVNERKLIALNKTVEIQNRMLASTLHIDNEELTNVVNAYTNALELLDDYDHQTLKEVNGRKAIYLLTYDDCRKLIDSMEFSKTSNLFGVEKEEGKLNGILAAVYQEVFGQEAYPSLESKAIHLLYFLVKDHPFYDGCKRIAATLFLEFLNKNHALVKDRKLVLSNDALVAMTLLIAESNPDEMDMITKVFSQMLIK
jgi:prophage maintenance system killer protein